MKKLIFFLSVLIFANELTIESKSFKYNSNKMMSEFTKDVNATKGEDNILCDKMYVYFGKNKKVKYLDAIGHVKFRLKPDANTTYVGESQELQYYVKSGNIILKNGYVKRLETNDTIKGEIIKMNKFTKNVDVKSAKGPVKINLKVED